MKKYVSIIILSVVTALWIAFIWGNSAQSGEVSGEASGFVCELVNSVARFFGREEPVSEHFIRKLAHFTEYAILASLASVNTLKIFFLSNKFKQKHLFFIPLASSALAFLVALVDEFVIQMNTLGRGPSMKDVFIDLSGAMTGAFAVLGIALIVMYIRTRKRGES